MSRNVSAEIVERCRKAAETLEALGTNFGMSDAVRDEYKSRAFAVRWLIDDHAGHSHASAAYDSAAKQLEAGLSALEEENARLRAGLELLAAVRHVSGSAQGHMRSQLRIIDALLSGADLRDLATVEAVAAGTWTE